MKKTPLVSFGIVNCNRLHYLKSCFESILHTTKDYSNLEFIIVDNASVESGTDEFLSSVETLDNVKVFRQESRDPANEFAKGLNIIAREARGEFIVPLQGDMQFVAEGWLRPLVEFYQENLETVGYIVLDAQRGITNGGHKLRMSNPVGEEVKFVFNWARPPIAGAGDVMFSKQVLDVIYPWSENNGAHEGGNDSETDMLTRYSRVAQEKNLNLTSAMPIVPVSIAIYTDARGTNARVRGNRRYGDYWAPKKDFCYYETFDYSELNKSKAGRLVPVSIEEIAVGAGWDVPVDQHGNWLKNPINPDEATENDFVELANVSSVGVTFRDPDYLEDWMSDDTDD